MENDEHSPRAIFLTAAEISDPEERAYYLQRACTENEVLRREVEELLSASAKVGGFLADRVLSAHGLEEPGSKVGRYKILQKIGEGGCGIVYMAEQMEPVKRRVALKVIKLGMDTKEVIARFEAERQALALMDHPHIAKVLDGGATSAGIPYFVMELVRGIPITRFCDQNCLPTRQRLELFVHVCLAIQHAHQKGIIHRDIKPTNILVADDDGTPVPKVIDFGIAKATAGQTLTDKTLFTAFEQFIGTPAYMSPEQAKLSALDVDTRSDIYSLGVLLYELLTGRTPFDTKRLMQGGLDEIRRIIQEEDPPRPSTRLSTLEAKEQTSIAHQHKSEMSKLLQGLRGDLDWIVMKCLEKERARRYETSNALAMDIRRHLTNETVVARPPSRIYEFQKMWRRHRVGIAATGAIMTVLAAATVISVWQAIRAQHERQHVQENVVRQYVGNGARLMNDGDMFGALLWFTEALRLDAGDPRREASHRIRIAAILRQCPKLLTVFSHGKMLYHAEFSPDGTKVVTASDDHTARVWDATTGLQLLVLPHDDQVYDAKFSPDGRRLITSSRDKSARIWDASSGALLCTLQHTGTVWQGCFAADGRLAATACGDQAQLWDPATGKRVRNPFPHGSEVDHVYFSPDGRFLGSDAENGEAFLWNIATSKLEFRYPNAIMLEFSPDGQKFLTYGDDSIHVRDTHSFKELSYSPLGLSAVYSAFFSPDGRAIVASGEGFTAQVWDASSGHPLFSPSVKHTAPILMAAVSPDGRRFATAGQDTVAQIWSTASGQPVAPPLKLILHVKYVAFNEDGRRLLANSCDQAARLWDMATGEAFHTPRPTFENEHRLVSPDGRCVLMGEESNSISITDITSGNKVAVLPHAKRVDYASFSRDGRSVITGCSEANLVSSMPCDIYLWDAHTGRRLNAASMGHGFRLLYAAFSPDNRRLLTCGFDFTARVWDAQTGQPLTPPLRHREQIRWGAFSPDGRTVVTASWDRTARVWDAATGNPLTPPLLHKETVVGASWSADGKRLTTLTQDDQIQVWDLDTGEPLTPARKAQPMPSAPQMADDLPSDNRPVADLVLLAQMLAVGRVDSGGSLVPLQLRELTGAWQTLRTKYPEQFAATPSEVVAWHRQQTEESQKEGNLHAALFHLDQALAVQPGEPLLTPWRAEVAAALARGANPSSLVGPPGPSFPPRDPHADAKEIDLSAYYTGTLHAPGGNDFGDLPEGLQSFGGVPFDIRGLVELNGQAAKDDGSKVPDHINGIRICQKCRRLHFLQGAEWDADQGMEVGNYVLHYADGQSVTLPIVFGRDLEGWWTAGPPIASLPGAALPVWNGINRVAAREGFTIVLYKSTRENPRPEIEITSIDFISTMTRAAPFLIALTVE